MLYMEVALELKQSFNYKSFIITFLCGFAACLILGFLFFQADIFIESSNKFILLILSLAGALVFSCMLYRSIIDSIIVLVAVFILNIVFFKTYLVSFIIRDIVLFCCLWLSIYLYKNWFFSTSGKYKFLRSFGLGIIAAILLFTGGFFLIFINVPLERVSIELIFQISMYYLRAGLMIGLGLGIGFDFADLLISKVNPG